jgi:hypothetical protein
MTGSFNVTLEAPDGGGGQSLTGSFDAPLCNAGPRAGTP